MENFSLTQLKKKDYYFFLTRGEEQVLIDDFVEIIKEYAAKKGIEKYSDYFSDDSTFKIDWNAFAEDAYQTSFFFGAKIIHLQFSKTPSTYESKKLEELLSQKNHSNIYIISIGVWSRDKIETQNWYRLLQQNNCLLQYVSKLKGHEYPDWILKRAEKKLGYHIQADAIEMLTRLFENNLIDLSHLLDQFKIRGITNLTTRIIETATLGRSNFTIFQYVDELLKGNNESANKNLNRIFDGEDSASVGTSIINLIKRELKMIYKFSEPPAMDNIHSKDVYLSQALIGRDRELNSKFNAERVWNTRKVIFRSALSRINRRQLYHYIIYIADIEFAAKNFADKNKQLEYLIDFTNAFTKGSYALQAWKHDMEAKELI